MSRNFKVSSRLGLEAMMSRLGLEAMMSRLGRFGPRSSFGYGAMPPPPGPALRF